MILTGSKLEEAKAQQAKDALASQANDNALRARIEKLFSVSDTDPDQRKKDLQRVKKIQELVAVSFGAPTGEYEGNRHKEADWVGYIIKLHNAAGKDRDFIKQLEEQCNPADVKNTAIKKQDVETISVAEHKAKLEELQADYDTKLSGLQSELDAIKEQVGN